MSLRRIACITAKSLCDKCHLINSCAYTTIFEKNDDKISEKSSHHFLPYVIEPPSMGIQHLPAGRKFKFHMIIFGSAIPHFSLILLAWRRALSHGLGKEKTVGRLVRVVQLQAGREKEIWCEDRPHIAPHPRTTCLSFPSEKNEIILRFDTPLRLQRQGKVLGSQEITAADLIASCLRRSQLVSLNTATADDTRKDIRGLIDEAKTLSDEKKLKYVKWSRHSSRQGQKIELPGLIGYWHIQGQLKCFLPALYLCEQLHVGKNTTLGLGKYIIDPDK